MISVVTVPHTGTIYTLELLRRWGVETERKHLENTDAPPYGGERFGPGYPGPSSDEWATYPDTHRVVCTLRDPILAVISAINRGVPDRMISVDGWAVLADWYARSQLPSVHFFAIPPTCRGLVELGLFVDPRAGWLFEAGDVGARNTSKDRTGLAESYAIAGAIPDNPTVQRAAAQLADMPTNVEGLFLDHGFDLPCFGGVL